MERDKAPRNWATCIEQTILIENSYYSGLDTQQGWKVTVRKVMKCTPRGRRKIQRPGKMWKDTVKTSLQQATQVTTPGDRG